MDRRDSDNVSYGMELTCLTGIGVAFAVMGCHDGCCANVVIGGALVSPAVVGVIASVPKICRELAYLPQGTVLDKNYREGCRRASVYGKNLDSGLEDSV